MCRFFVIGLTVVQAQNSGDGWPNSARLMRYGFGGMSQPAGMGDIEWQGISANDPIWSMIYNNTYEILRITFSSGTSATHSAVLAWFNNNGWAFKDTPVDYYGATYTAVLVKGTYEVSYYISGQKTGNASGWIIAGNTGVEAPTAKDLTTPEGKAWVIQDWTINFFCPDGVNKKLVR
ncbi:hypothetical protein K7I13_08820 [Brucepastera parasyntrophica]|uniref:hypothetical protein n=1 Tax=Brucepastera parasyntrophica TaxID=2880008 RepID=UPI00210C097E|nr:hypothetical protein [Brucepastera parasyntrophica]ULQ58661.1 hypothetical protein K7I13_08820 [Brucepastera parasyntrophica]